jgi:hypothetical protein
MELMSNASPLLLSMAAAADKPTPSRAMSLLQILHTYPDFWVAHLFNKQFPQILSLIEQLYSQIVEKNITGGYTDYLWRYLSPFALGVPNVKVISKCLMRHITLRQATSIYTITKQTFYLSFLYHYLFRFYVYFGF